MLVEVLWLCEELSGGYLEGVWLWRISGGYLQENDEVSLKFENYKF